MVYYGVAMRDKHKKYQELFGGFFASNQLGLKPEGEAHGLSYVPTRSEAAAALKERLVVSVVRQATVGPVAGTPAWVEGEPG